MLNDIGTPIVNAARARDTPDNISLTGPTTSRLGALEIAPLGELQRHAPDPSAQTLYLQPPTHTHQPSLYYPHSATTSASALAAHGPSTQPYYPDRPLIAYHPEQAPRPTYTVHPHHKAAPTHPQSSFGSPADYQPRPHSVSSQLHALRQNLANVFGTDNTSIPASYSATNNPPQLLPQTNSRPPLPPKPAHASDYDPAKRRRIDIPDPEPAKTFLPDDEAVDSAPLLSADHALTLQKQPAPTTSAPVNLHPSDVQRIADSVLDRISPHIAQALATLLQWPPDAVLSAMTNPPPPPRLSSNAPSQNALSDARTDPHGQQGP